MKTEEIIRKENAKNWDKKMKSKIVYNEDGSPAGVLVNGNYSSYVPLLTDELVNSIRDVSRNVILDEARKYHDVEDNLLEMIFGVETIILTDHSEWVAGFQYDRPNSSLVVYTKREYYDNNFIDFQKFFIIENVIWDEVVCLLKAVKKKDSVGRIINDLKSHRKSNERIA